MNRATYLFFIKCFFALFLLSFSNNVIAWQYTAINSGDFNSFNTWGDTPMLLNGDNYTIDGAKTVSVTVTTNLKIGTLTLNSGSTFKINTTADVTITIADLVINSTGGTAASIIDCGLNKVTLIVTNSLNGSAFSTILNNPSAGKTQQLILQGVSNRLYKYTSGGAGTSLVTYNGANQEVFNSDGYSDLELIGTGSDIKTLVSSSGSGVEATVKNKLTILQCKLRLNTLNFNYNGTNANLICNNGWIHTNNTGAYSSKHSDDTRTFPVGNANAMLALSLTNISGNKITVRFGTNGTTVPNSGVGSWFVTPANQTSTTITFIKAGGISSLSAASNIARVTASGLWTIQPTTYTSTNSSYSISNVTLPTTQTEFSIFTCPPLAATPTTLPGAIVSDQYREIITLDNGTSPYSLINVSSSPGGMHTFNAATDKVLIDFSPVIGSSPALSFTIQDATGCTSAPFNYTIDVKDLTTTWNGSSWSNGPPNNQYAVIAGPYTTALHGNISASKITVLANQTLTISISGNIISGDSIVNYGTIVGMCGSDMQNKSYSGTPPISQNLIIAPATMPAGIVGQPYNQTFSIAEDASASFSIENSTSNPLPSHTFNGTTLSFTETDAKVIRFDLIYKNGACVVREEREIKIVDLPSPNLTILNIGQKTYGDNGFKIRTYTRSTAGITYTITTSNPCAFIRNDSIFITCAGPSPQNIIVVKAAQISDGTYKAATATETFVIKPAAGRIIVRNNAFILGQSKAINVFSRWDANPVLSFDQLSGVNVARVENDGMVTPLATGQFSVRISLAASNNYTAFDSTYTFNVITLQKPPIAIADTIVLEMGKDSTFNILDNDIGMTEEIMPNKTDIDIENSGIQIKYYSTELGNFLIDPQGNLTILPFNGFIGSGRLGYTVSDINGLRSDIAYVEVIVNPPYVVPELKVNDVMTPNGDNLNDALVIANTDLNNENSLTIMDQAGNTVYETINYQNDWEGVDNKNNKLEPGVYFYVFKEKNSGREMKNYIQIVK